MRIGVVIRRVVDRPWPRGLWALRVAQGLAAHGHDVSIITSRCALDDEKHVGVEIHDCAISSERRALDGANRRRWIRACRTRLDGLGADVTVSFDPLIAADIMLEESGGAMESLAPLKRPPWVSLAHRHLPLGRERLGAGERMRVRARVIHGAMQAPGETTHDLGWGSELALRDGGAAAARRDEARRALGASDSNHVWLLMAPPRSMEMSDVALEALATRLKRPGADEHLLIVGPSSLDAQWRMRRLGMEAHVTPLGRTLAWELALDAADAGLAPGAPMLARARGVIADMLRTGTPVIADRAHPGSELLSPRGGSASAPGALVERATASDWRRAMDDVASPGRLEVMRKAALEIGAEMGIDAFIDKLEALAASLGGTAARAALRRAS